MRGRKPTVKMPTSDTKPQAPVEIPSCPAFLKGDARREWTRVTKLLFSLEQIAELDRPLLAVLCGYWGQLCAAEAAIEELGFIVKGQTGAAVVNPWLAVRDKAAERIERLSEKFGFSPADRARLFGVPRKQTPTESKWKGLLANAG